MSTAISDSEILGLLSDLAAVPTAPLHEEAVARIAARYAARLGLSPRLDRYGNLIIAYHRGSPAHPVALVAHLDHPGFEISDVGPGSHARAILRGGMPAACFTREVPVLVVTDRGTVPGVITGAAVEPGVGRVTSLDLTCDAPVAVGDFAVADLPGLHRDGDELAMRAADDLAGTAVALSVLRAVVLREQPAHLYVLLTRAEEIGLIGAALIAEQRILPAETVVVSIECSRTLPGAELGQGPVIRVGDRSRSFHPEGEALLLAARDRLPLVPIQRQLMSGGTCEATAFAQYGYRVTGVALPLENYHNVGQGNIIAPERIHWRDLVGAVALLDAAITVAGTPSIPASGRRTLEQRLEEHRAVLARTAERFVNEAVEPIGP
ncbi:MAG: hypothetical protein IRY83_10770 [Chloroflexi bacterium]|nr:hypothetical protein [Chloroflexota bacterium]